MRAASRTSMAPFSLRFTSDSSVRSSSPMGGQLAADGGAGQRVGPALRAPRGLGGVEALQIGLHKIPVLFHHSSSTSNS